LDVTAFPIPCCYCCIHFLSILVNIRGVGPILFGIIDELPPLSKAERRL
jgi:hypothetical protein